MSERDRLSRTEALDGLHAELDALLAPAARAMSPPVVHAALAQIAEKYGAQSEEARYAHEFFRSRVPEAMGALEGSGGVVWRPTDRSRLGVGDVEVLKRIDGDQGNAHVYKVRTKYHRVALAIKLPLTGGQAPRTLQVARLFREMQALSTVDHPHVVRVYEITEFDVGDGTPQVAIVQEFIEGTTLQQLDRATITARRAAEIVQTIAETLDYLLHGRSGASVMHLDLKPQNIMIRTADQPRGSAGTIVLIDFGSAAAEQGFIDGLTPRYIPPERLADPWARPTPAWDVFNLGGILYFLLTGDHPPPDGTTSEHALPPTVDRVLRTILRKCRTADPGTRYKEAAEVGRDLRLWLDDYPVPNLGLAYGCRERMQLLVRRCRSRDEVFDHSQLWGWGFILMALTGVLSVSSMWLLTARGVPVPLAFNTTGDLYALGCLLIGVALLWINRRGRFVRRMLALLVVYVLAYKVLRIWPSVVDFGATKPGVIAATQVLMSSAMAITFGVAIEAYRVWIWTGGAMLALSLAAPLVTLQPWFDLRWDATLQVATQLIFQLGFAWTFLRPREPQLALGRARSK